MPIIAFTPALQRFLPVPTVRVEATTVHQALAGVFADRPALRGYVLDDQGRLRRHVNVFVNGELVRDRARLSDPVGAEDEIYVFQALTGG
jgi:sulfur carrier protein ThiS